MVIYRIGRFLDSSQAVCLFVLIRICVSWTRVFRCKSRGDASMGLWRTHWSPTEFCISFVYFRRKFLHTAIWPILLVCCQIRHELNNKCALARCARRIMENRSGLKIVWKLYKNWFRSWKMKFSLIEMENKSDKCMRFGIEMKIIHIL